MRRGSTLIVVAGLCALLAALAIAFLARMRSDDEESLAVVRDAQARIMLTAACDYVMEASRLGLGKGTDHAEGYGWIDVRDGFMGPKKDAYTAAQRASLDPAATPSPNFPIGTIARFPLHVWQRTRFATSLQAVYNPIRPDRGLAPYLSEPDPQPVVANGWPGTVVATAFDDGVNGATRGDYVHGDPRPRPETVAVAWFRVKRVAAARFLVTCGAGSTFGWKDWTELSTTGATADDGLAAFNGDRIAFEQALAAEVRLWYLIEWSPAVGGATYQCVDNEQSPDHYQWRPFNPIHEYYPGGHQSQPHARDFVGTIRWIQRLKDAPTDF